jgi:hypothetical protein
VKSCCLKLWFLPFPYISRLRGLFHCVQSAQFIWELFSFHSKRFLFTQYTAISIKSEGIKLEYALFKILQRYYFSFISVFCFLFPGCCSFRSTYVFSLHPVKHRQTRNNARKGFHVCICSLSCTLCDLGKSEIKENLHFSSKLTEI